MAASQGGADPVTAVANAVGQIFDFGKSVMPKLYTRGERTRWLDSLYKPFDNYFGADEKRNLQSNKTNTSLYIGGGIVVIVLIILITDSLKKK